MQHQYQEAEIAVLETLLAHYQCMLNKSLEEDEEFEKTKKIFHEIRKIKEKLEDVKNLIEKEN
jgi:hypothetical protein